MTHSLRTLLATTLLFTAAPTAALAAGQDPFTVVSNAMQTHAFPQACTALRTLFDSTHGFADLNAGERQRLVNPGSANAWIAAAQAAQNAERHAEACSEYFLGVVAYRADGNTNMANIWSSGAVSESKRIPTPAMNTDSKPVITDSSLTGEYSCASFQGNGMLVSTLPALRVTSASAYDALGRHGAFRYAPVAKTTASDVIGTLTFTTGGLAGKTGYANRKSNGDRAIIFSTGVLDLSTTWCYGPK